MITVLVVDDHELIRSGLASMLGARDDIDLVGEAADGAAAVRECTRLRPDVVLMDVRMPVLDGIEATRALRAAPGPGPRVLVLTTFDLDEYAYQALRAGADGFLLKDTPPARIADAVRTVARGLSNAEIGGTLFVSEATVKTHLTRVFGKLGLRDRVQAVVLAYECGLVEPGDQPQTS